MAEERVGIVIAPDGAVLVHVEGVAGERCLEDTEDLIRLLGNDVEAREPTQEAYQRADVTQDGRLWQA